MIALLCFLPQASAAVFTSSGGGEFGGAISGSTMNWTDNVSFVNVTLTKGAGSFNDRLVIHLATGVTGRNEIGTNANDRGDGLRSAMSYMEGSTKLTLTLPTGFDATRAIGIDSTFGGLWAIPATGTMGNNQLSFVGAVDDTLTSATQPTFNFSFALPELGLTPNSNAPIKFVATYRNPFGGTGSLGFASNEGYGNGLPTSNIGQASFAFSGSPPTYTTTADPEPTTLTSLAVIGIANLMTESRRRRPAAV